MWRHDFRGEKQVAPTENLSEYIIVERKMAHLFYISLHKARKVAITIFVERKKSDQTLFLKIS